MKSLELFVAILALAVGCVAHACAGEQSPEEQTVRIMTLNIWHDGNAGRQPLSQTVKVIQMAKADIVGLQEVRKNARAIAEGLGWYHLQHGGDTAILSRFEITGTTKNKLGVKIRHDSGDTLYVFNVHLMHTPYQPYQLLDIPYNGAPFLKTEKEAIAAAAKARGHEVERLLEDIKGIDDPNAPVFITGDFNEPSHLDWTEAAAEAGHHPISVRYPTTFALEKSGFVDAYRSVYPNEIAKPGFTWTPRTTPDDPKDHHDRIDFVLCRGAVATTVEVVGENREHADIVVTPYPSDHRAVVAGFLLGTDVDSRKSPAIPAD